MTGSRQTGSRQTGSRLTGARLTGARLTGAPGNDARQADGSDSRRRESVACLGLRPCPGSWRVS
ncbi:hypothetical protein [Cobetia sp. MMG027]|uniref:hypothetical protein n=1 Tax=Cobetia sp. MMG027 TaxID=3021980 RepID=UPI003FA4BCF7